MSQAHYAQCAWISYTGADHGDAVARMTLRNGKIVVVCKGCLDTWLDFLDRMSLGESVRLEPRSIEWLWDAGTRTCPLHHWPDVLCADWGIEHAAMIRGLWSDGARRTLVKRGAESYGDLARRLLS